MDPQTERTIGKLVKNIKKLAGESNEYRAEIKQLKHDYRQVLLGMKDHETRIYKERINFINEELVRLGTYDADLCK